jgi:hypothetical protein
MVIQGAQAPGQNPAYRPSAHPIQSGHPGASSMDGARASAEPSPPSSQGDPVRQDHEARHAAPDDPEDMDPGRSCPHTVRPRIGLTPFHDGEGRPSGPLTLMRVTSKAMSGRSRKCRAHHSRIASRLRWRLPRAGSPRIRCSKREAKLDSPGSASPRPIASNRAPPRHRMIAASVILTRIQCAPAGAAAQRRRVSG